MKTRRRATGSDGRWIIAAAPFAALAVATAVNWCLCSIQPSKGAAGMLNGGFPAANPSEQIARPSLGFCPQQNSADPIDLIIVPESEPWALTVAAPLASKLRHQDGIPIILALPPAPTDEVLELIERISPRRCLLLEGSTDTALALSLQDLKEVTTEVFSISSCPTEAGLDVARRYWNSSGEVVLACVQDPEAMLLGSSLAVTLEVPFVPLESYADMRAFSGALADIGADRVFLCLTDADNMSVDIGTPANQAEILDSQIVHEMLIERLGREKVRNILVTRAPRGPPATGITSWLAPYLGLIRGSLVVPCDSSDGRAAEERVYAVLKEHSLKPSSVTILADYSSIEAIPVRDPETLGEYTVDVEPCAAPAQGGAAALGVGRIPHYSVAEASLFVARSISRERLIGQRIPRLLLVANPENGYSQLPLCETISRATAEEFKNFRVSVSEFYGRPTDDPAIRESAGNADLIIYEGHISDQRLFENPPSLPDLIEWCGDSLTEGDFDLNSEEGQALALTTFFPETSLFENGLGKAEMKPEIFCQIPGKPDPSLGCTVTYEQLSDVSSRISDPQLDGLPVLIFQSCHSLEESLAWRVFQCGATAMIGTSTNVHSASGSAFVKAFCDGLLYRGDTVGEALRDARNYFFCLAELKARRGHKEQSKVFRAALSFRLWGDPELRIPRHVLGKPKLQPVAALLRDDSEVFIWTPARRLNECTTDKYFVRMFPGSKLAGVVKRLKGRPMRRLTPMYFARLSMPEGFTANDYRDIQRHGDTSPRGTFLADPFSRFLYVLYFPEKIKKREEFLLQFTHVAQGPGNMLNWEEIHDGQITTAGVMDGDCSCLAGRHIRCDSFEGQAGGPPVPW